MRGKVHCIIPDTQCKPGAPLEHLLWASDYIADRRPDVLIHVGDHWDMQSLSTYDRGKRAAEGRRYKLDIMAGNKGMDLLMSRLVQQRSYRPRKVFCVGNHEERMDRAANETPQLFGHIGMHDTNLRRYGWEVVPFLKPIKIDGVTYAHYFYNPNSGKPYGSQPVSRVKEVGFSFTMGHQQGKAQGERYLPDGTAQRALIVGSYYQHDEDYKGPQGNEHWRGIIIKHEVCRGNYDLMEVSLGYLQRRFYRKHPRASRKPIVVTMKDLPADVA